jgi:hypothetical protein
VTGADACAWAWAFGGLCGRLAADTAAAGRASSSSERLYEFLTSVGSAIRLWKGRRPT